MAVRISVTECPRCGAPINPANIADLNNPVCPFCETALPVEEEPAAPVATPMFTMGAIPTYGTLPMGAPVRARRLGCMIAAPIAVLAIIGIVVGLALHGGSLGSLVESTNYELDGPVQPVLPGTGTSKDIYVLASDAGNDAAPTLRRVDPYTGTTEWQSAAVGTADSSTNAVVVAAPGEVMIVSGTSIVGINAASGHQLWQASLSTPLANPCVDGCAVVNGSHLITLAEDGTVQSFSITTGAQSWSGRLTSSPRWLEAAGGLVLSDESGAPGSLNVELFDPASGTQRTISPVCATPSDGGDPARPDDEGDFFVSPDGNYLTVLIANSEGCVARYRLSDGHLMWRTAPDINNDQIPVTLSAQSAIGTADYIAWTNDANTGVQIFSADTASGAIRQQYSDNDASAQINMDGGYSSSSGSTLVFDVAPGYNSSHPKIYGVNPLSGASRWQLASRVAADDDNQAVEVTSSGVLVVSCQDKAETCTFEGVDPVLGTITHKTVVDADLIPSVDDMTMGPSELLVNVNNEKALVLNPSTGTVEATFGTINNS